MQQNSIRINKYISESGLCSRREADRFIERGVVFINERKANIGDMVKAGDRVRVNGNELEPFQSEDIIFIALNKPVGITSTTEGNVHNNIVQFVNHSKRIFPIGRLDKASEGLIFMTNDGDIVNKILRARNNHEKEYIVTVDKPITAEFIKKMANGVPVLDTITKKCLVQKESEYVFKIVLTQGLNRQIRRMCEYLHYEVVKLKRTRIMNVSLKNIAVGKWRNLTKEELNEIMQMVESSSKTEEASYRDQPRRR